MCKCTQSRSHPDSFGMASVLLPLIFPEQLFVDQVKRTKKENNGEKYGKSGSGKLQLCVNPFANKYPGQAAAKQLNGHAAIPGGGFNCGLPPFLR
jgi:hypothetical protein